MWNYYNFRRTTNLQKTIRADTVKLEEFRRVRNPIDAGLTDLKSHRDDLRVLAKSGLTHAKIRSGAKDVLSELIKSFSKLQSALEDANASAYATGEDWTLAAEEKWDEVVINFDTIESRRRTEAEARTAINATVQKLEQLARIVNKRIDQEVVNYTGGLPITRDRNIRVLFRFRGLTNALSA